MTHPYPQMPRVQGMMSALAKFCKPEYNILDRCHTIRLGTLEYYRNMNPSFAIADATEAVDSVDINSMDFTTATPGAKMAVSPFIRATSGHQVHNVRLQATFPNCYIWCCSIVPDQVPDDFGVQFDPDYTSFYRITDANRFADQLISLLMNNITRESFSDSARKTLDELSIGEMGQIQLNAFHRNVLYVDAKLSTIDDGHLSPYVREIPQLLRPIFVKPSKCLHFLRKRRYAGCDSKLILQ